MEAPAFLTTSIASGCTTCAVCVACSGCTTCVLCGDSAGFTGSVSLAGLTDFFGDWC